MSSLGTALCPVWVQECLSVPIGHGDGSVPHWAKLSVPMGHGNSPVALLGTTPCHCQAQGRFNATLGHRNSSVSQLGTALCPFWAQGWLSVHRDGSVSPVCWGQLEKPWEAQRGLMSLLHPPTLVGGTGWCWGTGRHPGDPEGTLGATLCPWHGLACVPTPSADKGYK